jgi:prepilin-type N-terminal cleavage/methylation domain-containing protein
MFRKTGDGKFFGNQHGFTLVEVMLALLIVTLSVLAMYIMFINGRELVLEQQHKKIVLEHARNRLETMQYAYMQLDTVPRSYSGTYQDTIVAGSNNQVGIWATCVVLVEHSREININTFMPFYSTVHIEYDWMEPSEREYSLEFRAVY